MRRVLFLLFTCFVLTIGTATVFAQTGDKEDLADKIQKIQEEINQYKKQLNAVSNDRQTLEGTLASQRVEAKRLTAELSLVNSKIASTEKNIKKNRSDSSLTELGIDAQKRMLSESVNQLSQLETQSFTELWLQGASWSEIVAQMHSVDQLSKSVAGKVKQLSHLIVELDVKHTTLQQEKDMLLALQAEAKDKKRLYDDQVAETAALVARTKNQESIYQQEIATRQAQQKAFEDELFLYESQLAFKYNSKKVPKAGTAALRWPLDAVYITQRFGVTSTSGRLYRSGSHSGTDFRANNDPVYAMADGVVEGIGNTDAQCKGVSFGKFVFIRYNNGLASTFGHLALITATEGQKVKAGTLVGYSGNTGHSIAPHLHVSLYVSYDEDGEKAVEVSTKPSLACKGTLLRQPIAPTTAYLDPLAYMPKPTADMFKPGA